MFSGRQRRPGALAALGCLCLVWALTVVIEGARAQDQDALYEALRKGKAFAILRHAIAPGTSDPLGFDVDDCTTQRNLSDAGRRQAAEIGARFRAGGLASAEVYSSAWCRCLDTATHLGLGPVRVLPPLNSFFEARRRAEPQTRALKDWLAAYEGPFPLVLVTHQVNIRALTGGSTRSGETVIARLNPDDSVMILGRLAPP